MAEDPLIVSRPQEGVILLTLNRPAARNALDLPLRRAIAATLDDAEGDETVRVAVLTGGPRVFAAGADLKWLASIGTLEHLRGGLHASWESVARFPKPLIAAVEGHALGGGCELALHADIIVAGEGASFGQPEVRLGLMPGAGGSQRLLRAIGKYRTMLMVLTGDPVPAADAQAMGIVSKLVPAGEAQAAALALAGCIAAMPPLAIRLIKQAVQEGENLGLDAALAVERRGFQMLLGSADKAEGIAAFLEKRPATFTGA